MYHGVKGAVAELWCCLWGPHHESCLCNLTMAVCRTLLIFRGNSRASQASRSDCINKYIHNEELFELHDLLQNAKESLSQSWRTNHSRLDEAMNCVWYEQGRAYDSRWSSREEETNQSQVWPNYGCTAWKILLLRLREEIKSPQGVFTVTCLWNLAQLSQHRGPFKGYLWRMYSDISLC